MSSYSVQENTCNCHPETCSCAPWAVVSKGRTLATFFHRGGAESAAAILNTMQQQLAAAQAEARGREKQSHSWQDRAENADCRIARVEAEARELRDELRAELAEANKLRKLLHTFAVNVNSLGTLDAASQLVLDMKAFAALSQPAEQPPLMIRCQVCEHHTPVVLEPEPAQREGS